MKFGITTNMETTTAITAVVGFVSSSIFEGFGDWDTTRPDRGKQA